MPSRGSYQVANGENPSPPSAKTGAERPFLDPEKCQPPSRPDTSFRDCVLSLALVLLIIAILVLAVHPWDRNDNGSTHHGAAAVHGNKARSTTTTAKTETTTIENIERHAQEKIDKVDYDDTEDTDQLSSSSSSMTSSTTMSTTTSPESLDYDAEDEDNVPPRTRQADTTPTTMSSPILFHTEYREATTPGTEAPSPIDGKQHTDKPLTTPVADDTGIVHPMTTMTTQGNEVVTDQPQVEGDQTDDDTIEGTVAEQMGTTDVDFELAVAYYETTSSLGDDGITTPPTQTETETNGPRRSARLMEAESTPAEKESTTSPDGNESTTSPDGNESTTSPDGNESTTSPDGNESTTSLDGNELTTTPYGNELTTTPEVKTTTPNQETAVMKPNQKPRECITPACKKQAARMLGMMDHVTEPCQDFYQYACGGLRENSLLGEEDPKAEATARIMGKLIDVDNSTSSSALRKFRQYYDQCVDNFGDKEKRIDRFSTSAKGAVEKIDKLHTKDSWLNATLDLTELLTRLMLQHSTPLIDVTLDVSSNSPSKFALKLTPPGTQSLLRPGPARPSCSEVVPEETDLNNVYEHYLNCMSNHSRYLQEVHTAVVALRLFPQVDNRHREVLIEEIRQTIELDVWDSTLLETIPAEGEKRRQLLAKEYKKMTVRKMQYAYPMVDWRKLFSGLLHISVADLPDSAEVQVYFQPYFDQLFSSLQTKNLRPLHNSLLAMYARDLYVNALNGGPRYQRKDHCLTVASALMEDVASALYLSTFKSEDLDAMERDSQATFNRLRETLELQLQDAKWLDAGSRSDIVAKLHKMRIDASGGRDLFTDTAAIDLRMAGIDLDVSNDFIKLSTALTARYRQLMYSLYNKNPNNTEAAWSFYLLPYSTTAVSVYGLNSVMLPFGMLTWPLYDPTVPPHIMLARLGFVIAHEMAHHFDSTGINYRAGGGQGESVLMGGISSNAFNDYVKMECAGHSRYIYGATHTEPDNTKYNFKFDGARMSRNERLADDTANALSLDTALRWENSTETDPVLPYLDLTPAQEHFLAVAQMFCTKAGVWSWRVELFEREHPPSPHRVNDMLMNSVAFAKSFHCIPGEAMSPNARCEVFPALSLYDDFNDYSSAPKSE